MERDKKEEGRGKRNDLVLLTRKIEKFSASRALWMKSIYLGVCKNDWI